MAARRLKEKGDVEEERARERRAADKQAELNHEQHLNELLSERNGAPIPSSSGTSSPDAT